MNRFLFRFEKVLQFREAERQQRRAELAAAFQAERIVGDELARLEAELQSVREQSRQAAAARFIDVGRLLDGNRYELVLESRSASLTDRHRKIQAEVERLRQRVIEVDRQVRVLEKLRDRQRASHEQQQMKLEVRELDEAAAQQQRRAPR